MPSGGGMAVMRIDFSNIGIIIFHLVGQTRVADSAETIYSCT